ncbi:hypothetical protein [Nonomuraea fuscirosea]|uniref:hypothetical protein n=1 Tax=Nonomuraea fuscirosea TaxID=1291556 RepID=UPI00340F7D66
MRHSTQSIILGTAFFATVALPFGAQVSAVPNSEAHVLAATSPVYEPSPYQRGYDKGLSDGYARGTARSMNHCERDYLAAWPEVGEGAYKIGYREGFEVGFVRGFDDGHAKYCRPA